MSFQPFPNDLYVKTFNTGVIEPLCTFQNDESIYLKYIQLTMLKFGGCVGAESMVLKVTQGNDYGDTAPLFHSDPVLLSATGAPNASSWIGTLRFDFNNENISSASEYILSIELTNYTRTGSFFLSAVLDFPIIVYDTDDIGLRGAQIRIAGYK